MHGCLRAYLLVHDIVHHKGLHHIGDELWMNVGVPDLVVEELPNCALKLGTDLLWLVTDI